MKLSLYVSGFILLGLTAFQLTHYFRYRTQRERDFVILGQRTTNPMPSFFWDDVQFFGKFKSYFFQACILCTVKRSSVF